MTIHKIQFIILAFILIIYPAANAGVYISGTESRIEKNAGNEVKLYVEKDRIRMETKFADQAVAIVFRQDKDLLWMIDNKKMEYRQMTREDVKKLKSKMDDGMALMQEKMKSLSPEQQKMMAQMMPANMPVQKIESIMYTPAASGIMINSWTCTHYIGSVKDQKKQEIWATGWDQVNINSEDLQALGAMADFFTALAPQMTNMFSIGRENAGFSGMPVRTLNYDNDRIISDFQIKEISKKQFDKSLFEIPDNFSLKPIDPEGMFNMKE